jgi:peptidoglycan/xylan/chitin deacetylase (PgdA/CDA1 family)
VDAAVTMSNGTVQYFYVAGAAASADWAQVNASFTMPVGAVSASFYHDLAAVGSLTVDDVSLTSYTPAPFNHAVVSLSIDDGYLNEYTNGLPLFQKYGFSATYFVLPGAITYPDYITDAQIVAIHNAGMEIGDHTYDHCDLTGVFTDNAAVCPTPITQAQVMNQLTSSKTYLESLIGVPVTNFATPYGAYNSAVISDIQAAGLASHRSTDVGYNSADTLNPYNIKVQNITNTTTPADVAGWVANAIANKEWLVIVYHEVTTTPQDPTYAVTPANLDTELAGIKASGVSVKNISAALAELKPQAGL